MNIILLAVDTLRSRSMSCYGYGRQTCPNIDQFAREGVLFENTSSVAHNTHPVFTSLVTGMHPITHRVVRMNGNYHIEERRFQFLPEMLMQAGYRTVAIDNLVNAGGMVKASWMRIGIDEYIDYQPIAREQKWKSNKLCHLNKMVFPKLEELAGQPFFMFLHCWDTHTSYVPREEFRHRWYDGNPAGRVNLGASPGMESYEKAPTGPVRPGMRGPDPEDVRYTISIYDDCVSCMDAAFGDLMRKLEQLGLADDTLVILTSDHGENLGEHDVHFDHRWAYEDCIAIPLILRWPKGLPAGRRISAFAQPPDITTTILDLAGAPPDPLMDGISLAPVMRGETRTTYPHAHMHATIPDTRRAIRGERFKYIEWLEGCPFEPGRAKRELYDLKADPFETRNLIEAEPEAARHLKAEMDRWVAEKLDKSREIFGTRRSDPLIEQAWQGHLPYEGIPRNFRHGK